MLFKIRDASGERKYLITANNLTELTLTLNKSSKNVLLKCSCCTTGISLTPTKQQWWTSVINIVKIMTNRFFYRFSPISIFI